MSMTSDEEPMTKEQAQAYMAGFEAANAVELEELRSMSDTEKLTDIAALMASVDQMGWRDALAAEEAPVRELWVRLKRAYQRV